jgi:hypothetical protein
MVVVELYALVVEVFSLGSGVYFSPPELYGGGIVVLYQGVKLDDPARTDHIYHVIEALACYGGTKP